MSRNDAITAIKAGLKARSPLAWSVTGGRGTAYGWINICAPPRRRTAHSVQKAGSMGTRPEDFEIRDTGAPGGYMTPVDCAELARLLAMDRPIHIQGESIPASSDYYAEYIDRAHGRTPTVYGKQYWD